MDVRSSRVVRRAVAGATLVALAAGTTACASSASSGAPKADRSASSRSSSHTSSSPSTRSAATHAHGSSSCQAVQAVFLRLAGVTAGWDPAADPFDAKTAKALRPVIHQLSTQAKSATTGKLGVTVARNAHALAALESAMRSGRQQQVISALARSRHAYAALPSCAHRGHARTQPPSATGVPGGPPPPPTTGAQTGISSAAAQDPGCKAAKAAYTKLGPITADWDINTDPFDATVAAGFRSTAAALDAAASDSKIQRVSRTATANANAFRLVADAMAAKDAAQVDDSVITMQQTAVTLATTCPLS